MTLCVFSIRTSKRRRRRTRSSRPSPCARASTARPRANYRARKPELTEPHKSNKRYIRRDEPAPDREHFAEELYGTAFRFGEYSQQQIGALLATAPLDGGRGPLNDAPKGGGQFRRSLPSDFDVRRGQARNFAIARLKAAHHTDR